MIVIKGDIWFTIGGDGAKKKQVGQNVLGLPAGESLTRLDFFLPLSPKNCWLRLGKWVFHAHQKCRKKKKKKGKDEKKTKKKNLGNYYFIFYPLNRFVFVKGISFFFWPYKNQSGYTKNCVI